MVDRHLRHADPALLRLRYEQGFPPMNRADWYSLTKNPAPAAGSDASARTGPAATSSNCLLEQ
jgi:hypothetical protein